MSKVALITGITGQDGSYLAEFLLEKGYEVHGIVRRASISNTARIDYLIEKNVIKLHDGDLSDSSGLIRLVGEIRPDEIYNLAAQSHVQVSFDAPEYSGDVDALGVLRVLEAVRVCGLTKTCKVYQASTSELYGKVEEVPQKETTPFHPYSPYAVAKQYGFWMVKEYRDAYGMFAVNGILFNHESERRGENFVTRKITLAAGRIAEGLQDHLELGNMDTIMMEKNAKIYVAGHRGMVGSAIVRELQRQGYTNIVTRTHVFGFEESYGYLTGSYVRDKDGVDGAYMICEMFSYYATQGISLLDRLDELYKTYGYCLNTLHSYEFDGSAGFARMQSIMQAFRGGIKEFGGKKVVRLLDYVQGLDGLPKSDVLKFLLEDNCSLVVRPSGTEPKLKIYISVSAENKEMAEEVEDEIAKTAEKWIC